MSLNRRRLVFFQISEGEHLSITTSRATKAVDLPLGIHVVCAVCFCRSSGGFVGEKLRVFGRRSLAFLQVMCEAARLQVSGR